jgi:hypothetical protein
MKISRNDPCPCGSGKKYKRCCLAFGAPRSIASTKFRFEPGSYGGAGRGFMPSALCYQQTKDSRWVEYYCLVNPGCHTDTEDGAYAIAKADLSGAFEIKSQGGLDSEVANFLRSKGYVIVEDFKRAIDEESRTKP